MQGKNLLESSNYVCILSLTIRIDAMVLRIII